jgi:hypothetical protein
MHRAKRMLKTGMHCTRINVVAQSQLTDMSKPLKIRVRDDVKDQFTLDMDKTVNGIIDDFLFVQFDSGLEIAVSEITAE